MEQIFKSTNGDILTKSELDAMENLFRASDGEVFQDADACDRYEKYNLGIKKELPNIKAFSIIFTESNEVKIALVHTLSNHLMALEYYCNERFGEQVYYKDNTMIGKNLTKRYTIRPCRSTSN